MSYEIVIRLTVPDGTTVRFDGDNDVMVAKDHYVPPFQDELVPLPEGVIPLPGDPPAFRAPQSNQAYTQASVCPVHHVPWKIVPAGISRKSGQAYASFAACPERGCDQRPAR